jgi:crossover junction endodeoxyribonuclease RuvC
MVVLGIDPGFSVTGFGIAKKEGRGVFLMEYGDLSMSSTQTLAQRIAQFYTFFTQKVITHGVTDIALETPFLGKNAQTFLKLGYLRGILYLIAQQHTIAIHEFSPREVKISVTGFGGASKEQVARVVGQLFPKMAVPKKLDVTDAVAVTLCGIWKNKQLSGL